MKITTPYKPISGDGHILVSPWAYDSIAQGTWGLSGGVFDTPVPAFGNLISSALGDRLVFKVFFAVGTYSCRLLYTTEPSGGIIKVVFNSVNILVAPDSYAANVTFHNIAEATGLVVPQSRIYTIDILSNTKNGASSGYAMILELLMLWRTV